MYGSDRCLYELIKGIDKKQFSPVVILPYEGILSDKLKELGIKTYFVDPWVMRKGIFHGIKFIKYIFGLPSSIIKIIRIVKNEHINLVYSNTSVIIGAPLASLLCGVPHVYHLREFYDDYPTLAFFYRSFMCFVSKKIIAIGNTVGKQVSKRCIKKLDVVYDGIDLNRFGSLNAAVPGELIELRKAGYLIVSDIGRISRIKGQELFMEAARLILDKYKNSMFLIIGDIFPGNMPFKKHLDELANQYGITDHILFTGFRNDVDAFIMHSDIVVLTTLISEALGQVVMEGMAAGKVVVAPDKGGPTELIENDVDGVLYRSGDKDALANTIIRLINDPLSREVIGKEAREKAMKNFGISKNINKIQEILKELI